MKLGEHVAVALMLATTCAGAAVDTVADKKFALKETTPKEDLAALNNKIDIGVAARNTKTTSEATAKPTQPSKGRIGTDSAPVDGLDGKPHLGPFVNDVPDEVVGKKSAAATLSTKAVPTSLGRLKDELKDIPEKNDGVMDDDLRPVPRPGTTGTEGGVSEKEKTKAKQGPLAENKPTEPKTQPPLPHSEEERIREEEAKTGARSPKDDDLAVKPDGAMGIEKPDDLPAKPHDLPHPDGAGKGRLVDTMPYTEGEKPKPSRFEPPAQPVQAAGSKQGDSYGEWFHSFVVSLTMIIFTEIGDKTFLVAALMAMRHDRLVVFTAALSALITMTVLSAILGHLAPTLLPKRLTTLAAAALFLIFGARMLREGLAMSKHAGVGEEMEEVEAELEEKEHTLAQKRDGLHNLEAGRKDSSAGSKKQSGAVSGLANLLGLVLSPAWVQTFIMTFLGEWGDRSQIATIAMAAGQDYWWVTLGAILGHALCTGLAVIGGRALAGRVSMRVVTIGGAVAFLFFGVLYIVEVVLEG